jgi:hypothetical protein
MSHTQKGDMTMTTTNINEVSVSDSRPWDDAYESFARDVIELRAIDFDEYRRWLAETEPEPEPEPEVILGCW